MSKNDKIIIVGGNAAGPAAGAKAKRVNPDADVILFEAGSFISTGTCEIPYVLSNEIKYADDLIFFNPEEFYDKKGVKVFINHLVEDINTKDKFVQVRNLKDGTVKNYYYDKLVLATGSIAKRDLLVKDAINSFTLKNINDLVKIKEYINSCNVKNVSIIGSGFIGIETAEALVNIGCNVSMIEKELLPFPSSEPEIQLLIKELLIKNNVSFYPSADIKPVQSQNKISAISINGRTVDSELVINAMVFCPMFILPLKQN
jgi:NADPH-dependent 2,4-dienoyl-CoA reductase/sulfur reductase-like enzyme